MSPVWKEAATVILTGLRRTNSNSGCNYDLLSIKRSAKNSFMPGMFVFPGGAMHEVDNSKRWMEMFSKFSIKVNSSLSGTVPPILMSNDNDPLKLISLKITAVRETFEETGILLCTQANEGSKWVSSFSNENLSSWRLKVEKDGSEFFNLCQHFNCCPDVNNLHLWNNWLTPKSRKKRFDTIFFVASLADIPSSTADKNEIDEIIWHTPKELLEQNEKGLIILAPPQLYEISRLLNFTDCSELISFAKERAPQGCERWMPVYFKTKEGTVSILPGDDAYKIDNYEGLNVPMNEVEMTIEEFQSQSVTLHRFEGKKIRVKNYTPTNGHVLPIC